ncbi:protein vacuoleless1 [Tanacetum coccineum]
MVSKEDLFSSSYTLQMPIREACYFVVQRIQPCKQMLWKHAQARQHAKGQGPTLMLQICVTGLSIKKGGCLDIVVADATDAASEGSLRKRVQIIAHGNDTFVVTVCIPKSTTKAAIACELIQIQEVSNWVRRVEQRQMATFKCGAKQEMSKTLRVINSVRRPEIGIPLSIKQYKFLTPSVLIGRLVNAHQHLLALKISDYHGMNQEVVIMHWACSKLTVSSAILDPTLLEILLDKLKLYEVVNNHDELMSNFFAQPDALAYGKTCNGNRPSLSILLPSLDAYIIGQLLAIYEHKIAVEGESHVAVVVLVNMNIAVKMDWKSGVSCGRFVTQAMDYQRHYCETWILVNRGYDVWNWRST